jgi:general secretion pathway protein L
MVILQTAYSWLEYSSLKSDNLAMRQAMEKTYREVFPRGVVVNPEHQMRTALQTLRRDGGSANFIKQYALIGNTLSQFKGAVLTSLNYEEKRGEFRLNLSLADYQAVDSLRSRLASAGLTEELLSSSADNERVQARLRVSSAAEAGQ